MALTLTLREGHDFFIGDRRIVVEDVRTPQDFTVRDTHNGLAWVLDSEEWKNLSYAKLQAGIPRKQEGKIVRLLVDAPGEKVLRGDLYRESKKHPDTSTHPASEKSASTSPVLCGTCHGLEVLSTNETCETCGGGGCSTCHWEGKVIVSFKCPDCSKEK